MHTDRRGNPVIDPRKPRQQRQDNTPNRPAPAVMVSIALELASLSGLIHWGPYARRLEAVAEAMRGGEGVTCHELNQLRTWAHRWERMDPQLREFYETQATPAWSRTTLQDKAVSSALWRILEQTGERLEGWQYGTLKRLWIDQYGSEPSIEIAPVNQRKRRAP